MSRGGVIGLVVLLAMLLLPPTALAHDGEWDSGDIKGGSPRIECRAVGSYGGHTYTWTYGMSGDGGMPVASERAWLEHFCNYAGRDAVKGWFRHSEGVEIPDSAIAISFVHGR